ncbi:MAG: SpoIIE family protein phosphatase [Solirubrobacteraceae bacterium]
MIAVEVAGDHGAPEPVVPAPDGGPAAPAAPANVLLVDDHEENLTALSAVLEPLGERLVLARSGAEALRALLSEDFALILLDVHMPGLGGFETARYITARERTRHIPIIFLTAFAADIDEVFRGYEAGAVDYVTKPFEPEVLRSKVAVFVALHRERAQRIGAVAAQAKAEAATETIRKLQSLSDAALAHLDLDELLAEVVTRIRELFDADTAGIALTGPAPGAAGAAPAPGAGRAGGLWLQAVDGLEPPGVADPLAENTFVAAAAVAAAPLVFDRRATGPPLHEALEKTGVGWAVAVALRTGDELTGVLYLGSLGAGAGPGAADLGLLELCAERAATAIAHARTYEHEHELVELLQRSLLPQRLPIFPRLELAARYLPSVEATAVGGDWYDVLRLADGAVALVIGDVVGHGVQAATVMGELRNGLRAYILEGHGPAAALSRLDALVAATHGTRMVATLLVMLIEPERERLRFASAGHLPPLRLGGDAAAEFLSGGLAPPLGMIGTAPIEEADEPLAPGQAILLFTDGLIERRDESLDRSLDRLRRCAALRAGSDLETFCDQILEQTGIDEVEHRDDIALVTLRLLSSRPERLSLRLPAEPTALREMRRELTAWLQTMGAAAEVVEDLTLACSEAAANAVEHAYGPGDFEFEVEAEHRDGTVHIEVRDTGGWRPARGQLRGTGLKLIHQLADTAVVHRGEEGTRVELIRRLAAGEDVE